MRPHPRGGHEVATSRRHRKGLFPHHVRNHAEADRPRPSHAAAFLHLWAPGRVAWWVALLFAIGASLFALGSASTAWPDLAPRLLRAPEDLTAVFFVGSLFFTTAALLQWLEALNGDVTTAFDAGSPRRWRWFGWLPHNLGYLASAVQLVGTLLFNMNTADAALSGIGWVEEDLLVWTPNMLGCVCFLVASVLALVEVTQGAFAIEPRSISWWIAIINLAGSVAFQISAFYSVAAPTPSPESSVFLASLYTWIGAVCFLVGAYLMIPELFDEAEQAPAS
ncbi:MAG: hypothetical protein P8R42_17805 [Candidatus Binatia bacterium]|nr:hypothetical protein [Candidatus Binatia bacterium]